MTRPDLQERNGGWQAVDATPQELSYGIIVLLSKTQKLHDVLFN